MAQGIIGNINKWIYQWEMRIFPIDIEKVYVDQQGVKKFRFGNLNITNFYLPSGIKQLDSEYSRRIMKRNENPKKLRKEIKSNPHLHRRIKRNLIFNLNNYYIQ